MNPVRRIQVTFLCFAIFSGSLWAADEPTPAIEAFAKKIDGMTWDLPGTFSLKKLRFDGESMRSVGPTGIETPPYDTSFIDVGIVRLNFKGPNTGWYFFGPDFRFVTPCTVKVELAFKNTGDKPAKPGLSFPENVAGVAYSMVQDERALSPAKLRWTGLQLELASQQPDKSWKVNEMKAVVAGDRILESELNGETVWAVFSIDGREAWLIELENIFGGERTDGAATSKASAAPSGLTPQQVEMLLHIHTLKGAGEKVRAATLERHLRRLLRGNEKLLNELDKHLQKTG